MRICGCYAVSYYCNKDRVKMAIKQAFVANYDCLRRAGVYIWVWVEGVNIENFLNLERKVVYFRKLYYLCALALCEVGL